MNPVANDPAEYGDRIADVYDDWHGERDPVDAVVDVLAGWAREGPALELGIGTGRIALPLAARGIRVDGIDASARMLERLQAKPGGAGLASGSGTSRACPPRAAPTGGCTWSSTPSSPCSPRRTRSAGSRAWPPGGAFVIEAFVPDLSLYDRGQQRVRVDGFEQDATRLSASLHDRASQRLRSRALLLTAGGVQTYPVELRYAWPSELDLMARLAGMTLAARWEGWQQRPFTSASPGHVSVWQTPAA